MPAPDRDIHTLANLIKDIRICMLTTAAADGSLHSRPMATQRTPFDGDLLFLTSSDSTKFQEIRTDQHVNLAFADPQTSRYISVAGRAVVYYDRQKAEELWNPFYRAWFPKGLDDPDLAIVKVHVESAQYWTSPTAPVVHLLGFLKSIATGHRTRLGKNETIDLRGT